MSKAYPWVPAPHPTEALPRAELEERIHELLLSVNTCVLATTDKQGRPVASPIEYVSNGLELYMLPDEGSPKLLAMERDSYVSLAIHKNHNSWSHARGAQFFGHAEIHAPGTAEWEAGMEFVHWRSWAEQMEWSLEEPPPLTVVKITPERILYVETWLWKSGYGARQTWRAKQS